MNSEYPHENSAEKRSQANYAAADCEGACRGSRTANVLPRPAPGLEAEIVPPCWLMIRWLIERPRPVPCPAGLSVKNGSNRLSIVSGVMPHPSSVNSMSR